MSFTACEPNRHFSRRSLGSKELGNLEVAERGGFEPPLPFE